MHLQSWIPELVFFLAYKTSEGMRTVGTGFNIGVPLPGLDPNLDPLSGFSVTARHIVERAKKQSIDGKLYLRVNRRGSGAEYAETNIADWVMHPSKNVDAAVMPIEYSYEVFQQRCIPLKEVLTPERIRDFEIGPGDDLFFPGLFVHHFGEQENVPIIRTGSIAAMPGELIQTSAAGWIRAYLIEARSIGGLSGSPVFVHFSGPRATRAGGAWNHQYFLGMVQGHYGVRDILDAVEDDQFVDPRTRSINMGIAIVVPADDILSIVDLPRFDERKKGQAAKVLRSREPKSEAPK